MFLSRLFISMSLEFLPVFECEMQQIEPTIIAITTTMTATTIPATAPELNESYVIHLPLSSSLL